MMIHNKRVLAAGFVLLIVGTAGAAPATFDPGAAPAVIEITWSEIAGLVDAHPLLAAGEYGVEAAQGAVAAAGARPNPVLEAVLGRGRERPGEEFGR
ncbi:MAG: hypothetical protein IPM94_10025, partial [bacterium]|nr:hypothetical protein [bacterium]